MSEQTGIGNYSGGAEIGVVRTTPKIIGEIWKALNGLVLKTQRPQALRLLSSHRISQHLGSLGYVKHDGFDNEPPFVVKRKFIV